MVDAETFVDSRLAHVIAFVLDVVGVAALAAGGSSPAAFWFWLFYVVVWASFLDLFEESDAVWQGVFDRGAESGTEERRERGGEVAAATRDEDPVALLKRRYAAGEIDDAESEARIDALLDTPDTLAELEAERERT